ncbi:MAG: CRISPR system precrRNA processing endoribonuclease RAMP protein Cas6, partial [Syntrophobacteraceae bacterium]
MSLGLREENHITVGQFGLKLKALDEIHLPAYKGSTLRGGFGYALKEVSCALKRQECRTCMLRDRCVYLYLFETPPPPDSEMMRLYPTAPHPFIIEPPDNGDRLVPQGGYFEFGLTVVGRALDYLPYFIYAFLHLGEKGFGKGKGKFSLENVCAMSPSGFISVYQKENQTLKNPDNFPTPLSVEARCEALGSSERLTIHFKTPTRIKSEGRLTGEPEFHHLIRSLLRRLSALSYFHCDRKLDVDFKGLIER